MLENLWDRVKDLLLSPKESWTRIKYEDTTVSKLFTEYLIILTIVPALAGFLGSIFNKADFSDAVLWSIFYFVFTLIGVWVIVKILKYLAFNFEFEYDEIIIYKLVIYSFTPFLLSGIFFLILHISWLSVIGLYGFYLYFLGIEEMLDIPKRIKFDFFVISLLSILLILIFIYGLTGLLSGIDVYYLGLNLGL